MSELINRYVHQVGRYLPEKERKEIELELRSQIQDQLEDRYGASPSQADVASVLRQLGDPVQMASSYGRQQYLIGPSVYPIMMMVLRLGLPIVPALVVIFNVVAALFEGQPSDWFSLLISSIFIAAQATAIFAAAVVLIFAIVERSGEELKAKAAAFNPLELPPVDDPAAVDRAESSFGIAIGAFVSLALLYFLQVGGLTLRFNLSDPGTVTPVSSVWLIVMTIVSIALVLLNLWALLRNRWTFPTWLAQSLVELVGAVALYYIFYTPLFTWLSEILPNLRDTLLFDRQPAIFTAITIAIMLISNGSKLIRMWKQRGARAHERAQALTR